MKQKIQEQTHYTKVGRITMPVAKAARMKAADIYVDVNHIKHVAKKLSIIMSTQKRGLPL